MHPKQEGSTEKWFMSASMGVNKLSTIIKTMDSKANLNDERLTNHSVRKHMIQKLNDNEIPPTHIMQLSRHRNVQSISYHSSLHLNQKKMLFILSDTSQTQNTTSTKSSTGAKKVQQARAKRHWSSVKVPWYLGQFAFSVNTVTTSPTIETESAITQ